MLLSTSRTYYEVICDHCGEQQLVYKDEAPYCIECGRAMELIVDEDEEYDNFDDDGEFIAEREGFDK